MVLQRHAFDNYKTMTIIYSMYSADEASLHRACCERATQPFSLGDNRKKEIPMEILNDDGAVIRHSNSVFDKWKTDFSRLLNPTPNCTTDIGSVNVMQNVESNVDKSEMFVKQFSLNEVRKIIHDVKIIVRWVLIIYPQRL